jgi:hypothetical protein
MPEVVLRHPELPGQPIVLDAPGGVVSLDRKREGWVIDAKTDPDDARAESEATSAKRAAAVARKSVKPRFEDPVTDDTAPAQPESPKE